MSDWVGTLMTQNGVRGSEAEEMIAIAGLLAAVILRGVLATAVFADAEGRRRRGGSLDLLGPGGWTLIVLAGGLLGAALYWFVNGFRMRDREAGRSPRPKHRHHPLRLPRPMMRTTTSASQLG